VAPAESLRIVLEFARANDAGDPHAFRFAPQKYLVRGERGDITTAEVAWSRELLRDLEAVRLPGRDPEALHRVGEVLRKTLEPAGWRQHEGAIVDAVAQGRPVVVTVRSAAAELYALPWELLTLRSTGQSLGAISGVLLRYEWPATVTAKARELTTEPHGRVLIAWSAAGGAVPAAEHVAAIRGAQEAAGRDLDSDLDIIEHASFGHLADALAKAQREGPAIDALHLLCHGGATGSSFGLVFDGEGDGARPVIVDPGRLQQLLAPYAGMIRLVVLAACDSANAGDLGNRLGSVAQMLHRVGIAAVVASRYPLSIDGSIRLSEILYRDLLGDGATLEEAFVSARTALARDPTSLDWASVQLYARACDGDATRPIGTPSSAQETPQSDSLAAPHAPTGGDANPPKPPSKLPKLAIAFGALAAVMIVVTTLLLANDPPVANDDPNRDIESAGQNEPPTSPSASISDSQGGESTTTGSTGTGSTGTGSTGTDSSSSQENPPTKHTKKTKKTEKTKKIPKTTKTNARTKCPTGLREYLQDKTGGPPGGGVFKLSVKVTSEGTASLLTCNGCSGDLKKSASSQLNRVNAGRAISKGGDSIPCTATFDWIAG